ncbi:MAG: vanadium-dependent haloperoxidase [Myxococcales bacterium FL481]|nr:MAG: vanadium-dependent haloperoxidase [Myxococcales bacterium FL481]
MKRTGTLVFIAAAIGLFISPSDAHAVECAPTEPSICAPVAVIGTVVPNLLSTVAPGDAPLILRTTTLITASWFDAIAPYSPSAVGVYSDLGRLAGGDRERNIALLYASHEVLHSLMPQFAQDWDGLMWGLGLDPNDDSADVSTPVGVGNVAGAAVVAAREHDGMNQLGDEDGSLYNRRPYVDYTGYRPVNSAERLWNPRRWQPDTLSTGTGIFFSQQFVTPQLGRTSPFSYDEVTRWAPAPWKSYAVKRGGRPLPAYRQQADEVLAAQVALTDRQKLIAEFFDNKIISLGFSTLAASLAHQLSLEQFVQLDFLVNVAAFDTAITIWENKRHFDAVRPFSAIAYLYGETDLTAWGGPGRGVVDDITGSEWRPYLQSANHPEYPSASASFCRAHSTATKLYFEHIMGMSPAAANNLSFWTPAIPIAGEPLAVPAGGSQIEPGVTPAQPETLGWATWDEFANECGISRLWAGVHFYDSIPAGQAIGDPIGSEVYDWLEAHIDGAPE